MFQEKPMTAYVCITREEMERVLGEDFVPLTLPGTRELVYAKRVDVDNIPLSLRVYTSIDPSGYARDVGKDAIRVEVYYRYHTTENIDDKGISRTWHLRRVGGSKRVNRVPGWEDRLQERISTWRDQLGPLCGSCNSPMILRKGSKGKFYGCAQYPKCRNTQPYQE